MLFTYTVDVKKLKKCMIDAGIDTIDALCKESGVNRNTAGEVVSGKRYPSSQTMVRIAGACKMDSRTAGDVFFAPKLTDCVS